MLEIIIGDIQAKAEYLQYISEQTHDVNVFIIGRDVAELNEETFSEENPFINGQPIETFDAETIFNNQNWFGLMNLLTNELTNLTAFKVGEVRREVYIVGLFDGHIVGVRTFAVET